jgi:CRP-like cAMP-binding protein
MSEINNEWLEFFRRILTSFVEIPESELEKGLLHLKSLHLEKNEYFIRTGGIPDKMSFIVKGVFRVFYLTEDGDEKILVFREEGRMLSAYSAFLENKKSWYDIQALEDSDLLYIGFDHYQNLMDGNRCWRDLNARYTEMLFVEKEKRENEFLSDNAETRYKKFIRKYPGMENRINQYHIASYLGITPVALSRIKRRMLKNNIS